MSLHQINELFGPAALGHALFYSHSPALRFELSGGDVPVDQFSQAYDRARQLATAAFRTSPQVTVVLACSGVKKHAAMLRAARSCGVALPALREKSTSPPDIGSDGSEGSLVAFEVEQDVVPRLLWGVLAQELGVRPRLLGQLYLADLVRGVLLHPYDDRGMDVIGPGVQVLSELYTEFGPWLLEYDLQRMQEFFAGR